MSEESKSAAKKRVRREAARERMLAQKARRKERQREQRRERTRRAEAGELTKEDKEELEQQKKRKEEKYRTRKLAEQALVDPHNLQIVLDVDFEDYMTESEQRSLCSQVCFSYGTNLKADAPAHLYLSGVRAGGAVDHHLTSKVAGYDQWLLTTLPKDTGYMNAFPKEKLVYLTADAEESVDFLDREFVYIIGGLVDHNRHKGLTLARAMEQEIAVRKLPILPEWVGGTRRVLAVNQVVDLLLAANATGDWEEACRKAIPARKSKLCTDI